MQQETRDNIKDVKEKIEKLVHRLMFMRDGIDTQGFYANLAHDSIQITKLSADLKLVDGVPTRLLKSLRIIDERLDAISKKDRKDWYPLSAGFVWQGKVDIPFSLLITDSTVDAYTGASLILGRLGGIAAFTDIFVEKAEFYNDGIRYNWSFNTMLSVADAESLIQKALEKLRYTASHSAERDAVDVAVEELNFFRNCHYNAPSGTTEYELANAINDVLPLFAQIIAQIKDAPEYNRTCPNCYADIQKQWGYCPQCGNHIPPARPDSQEVARE